MEIYDEGGALVFEEVVSSDAGWNWFSWDGVPKGRKYPLAGQYRYRITTQMNWLLPPVAINIESSWNKENTLAATTSQRHSLTMDKPFN